MGIAVLRRVLVGATLVLVLGAQGRSGGARVDEAGNVDATPAKRTWRIR